ncbi:MAG: hypothetical protein UT05_C0005G0008 [Parcubacteria group bacterium GW2011_GWF2_38_76]|nr:MAG: hypothetical protein UT05_C0005G0008 [Parcubacteria group bacterium GW2011_GWF2_38_76]HBM45577.1 hypothetical protein [Patescibacteria group bacterium]
MLKQLLEVINNGLDFILKALPFIVKIAILFMILIGYGISVPLGLTLHKLSNIVVFGLFGQPIIDAIKAVIEKFFAEV